MARIRVYLCRGLPALATFLAIYWMARATYPSGGTDNSGRVMIRSMNHQEGDQQLISAVSKFDVLLISAVSKFDVLRDFKKEDTHSRLVELKKFLATLGYLPPLSQHNTPPTALFDDSLETALRLYQSNFNLSVTGILDKETLAILRVPRCGMEDVRNGLSVMLPKPKGKLLNDNVSRLPTHLPQQRTLTGDKIMWQTTRNLTYGFSNLAESAILSSDDIRSAVASAFQSWAAVVPIDFQETDDFEAANIKIEFLAGDHGDGWSFDGHLGEVAHAFPPEDGRLHFNRAEVWTVSMAITDDSSAMDLETVALHEIGHLIGLDHSNVYASVMFPNLETRKEKRHLTGDDIDGVTGLYGSRTSLQGYDIPQDAGPHAESENHTGQIAYIWGKNILLGIVVAGMLLVAGVYIYYFYLKFRDFSNARNAAKRIHPDIEL